MYVYEISLSIPFREMQARKVKRETLELMDQMYVTHLTVLGGHVTLHSLS